MQRRKRNTTPIRFKLLLQVPKTSTVFGNVLQPLGNITFHLGKMALVWKKIKSILGSIVAVLTQTKAIFPQIAAILPKTGIIFQQIASIFHSIKTLFLPSDPNFPKEKGILPNITHKFNIHQPTFAL